MPTETRRKVRQWGWFLLIWGAGVAVFGGAVYLLRALIALGAPG